MRTSVFYASYLSSGPLGCRNLVLRCVFLFFPNFFSHPFRRTIVTHNIRVRPINAWRLTWVRLEIFLSGGRIRFFLPYRISNVFVSRDNNSGKKIYCIVLDGSTTNCVNNSGVCFVTLNLNCTKVLSNPFFPNSSTYRAGRGIEHHPSSRNASDLSPAGAYA